MPVRICDRLGDRPDLLDIGQAAGYIVVIGQADADAHRGCAKEMIRDPIGIVADATEVPFDMLEVFLVAGHPIGIGGGDQAIRRVGRKPSAGLVLAIFEFGPAQAVLIRGLHHLLMEKGQDRIVIPGYGFLDVCKILCGEEDTRMVVRREAFITGRG